jgi:hypothetical protein
MKNEIEQQIFEKMKAKDFGESMCNETKLNILKWTMQQLRKHDVMVELPDNHVCRYSKAMNQPYPRKCVDCGKVEGN